MSKLKSAAQALLEIKSHTPDQAVAGLIVNALLESDRQPYCFAINHDVRPPKCLACPLEYDWSLKDHVGIETPDRRKAEHWITQAVLKGYTVSMAGVSGRNVASPRHQPYGATMSIPWARKRAKWHQSDLARKASGEDLDDDIPF
jgi:hypothetical protein